MPEVSIEKEPTGVGADAWVEKGRGMKIRRKLAIFAVVGKWAYIG